MRRFLIAVAIAGALGHLPCHAQRSMPPGDPNLNAHWDWTTDQAQTLFHHRPGQAPGRVEVPLPFFCPGNRLYQSPGNLFREDGWLLAHRDFGTEEAAPAIPYFTLYNKYRGIFRVMLCSATQPGDAQLAGMLQLHPDSLAAGHGAPLFTFSNGGSRGFRSDYEPSQVEVAFSPLHKGNAWMVFDFQVIGYDPDLGRKDPRLLFTLHRLPSSGDEWMNLGIGTAPSELDAALRTGGAGFRYYPSVRGWCETEYARASQGTTPIEAPFHMIGSTHPASCAPLVAALGERVNGWLGGTHAACPWEPISYRGQISTPVRQGLGDCELLSLSLHLHADGQGRQETQGHRPVQPLPWGLFNFEAAPVLVEHPILGEEVEEGSRRVVLAQAPRSHLNPEADLEALSMSFEANLSATEPGPDGLCTFEGFLPISTKKGPSLPRGCGVSDLIVTMHFKTRYPTREADDCYTVVRRLPCTLAGRAAPLALDVADPEQTPGATPRTSGPGTPSSSGPATPNSFRMERGSRLLLVSNRVPWTVAVAGGVGTLKPSSGGLATALARTHERSETLWVGWPGDLAGLDPLERNKILDALQRNRIVPVELSDAEVEHYYEGFSNGVLWPLFHSFLDKTKLEMDKDWDAYLAVNKRFAQATAQRAVPGDSVWIHDFQLMLVPGMLRELQPDLRIGFFLHIPFPAFEVFRVLPWRETLLQGVLGADLVGFHTQDYQAHFAKAASRILGAQPAAEGLTFQGRPITLGSYGIGIDALAFARAAASPPVLERVAEIRRDLGGRTLLLGVDRLDYTKGIPQRLLGVERYLEQHPDQRGSILLLQVAVPSRERVPAYIEYRKQVDEIAARINGHFGTPGRVPIHLLHQSFPFEGVVALYRAADVMLVTPLRDGMNLVAKEFCATRGDDSGVLILSEFTGAAQVLREAILVNPYDTQAMAVALDTALRMPQDQVRGRMGALRRQVATHDVHRWAKAFVVDLEAQAPDPGTDASRPMNAPAKLCLRH